MTASPNDPVAVQHPATGLIGWRNAVFVTFVLSGLSIASWVSRLPAVRDALELSTSSVGILILCMSVGSIVGLVAAPLLLARVGPRVGIITCVAIIALGMLLVGIGSSLVSVVVVAAIGLALFGLGNGAVDVIMNVEGAAAERAIGKTLMPLMHACFSVGAVVGAGLGAVASGLGVSVFVHLGAIAILLVVTSLIAVRFIPARLDAPAASLATVATVAENASTDHAATPLAPHTEQAEQAPRTPQSRPSLRARLSGTLKVWADMRLLLIGAVMLGMAFAEGSANDWLAIATVDGHGQSNTTGALVFGIFVAAMTVARVLGGPLLDRFGRVPVLRATAIIGVVGLLMFIESDQLWVVIIGTILWGFGASLGFPVGISAAADDTKNAAARVSAVAIVGYMAFLVGPPLLGLLGQAFGILNALYVVLALLLLSALAAPAARERTYPS
jgi:MFS family permease